MLETLADGIEQTDDTRQQLDELFEQTQQTVAKEEKEVGWPDKIDPKEKYGYEQAWAYLDDYFELHSSSQWWAEDGSSRESTRTSLIDIKWSTLIWARMLVEILKEQYGLKNKLVITWGTEAGHATKNTSDGLTHGDGEKLDIRCWDAGWKILLEALELKEFGWQYRTFSRQIWKTTYTQRVSFYLHASVNKPKTRWKTINDLFTTYGNDLHLDVWFWPIKQK